MQYPNNPQPYQYPVIQNKTRSPWKFVGFGALAAIPVSITLAALIVFNSSEFNEICSTTSSGREYCRDNTSFAYTLGGVAGAAAFLMVFLGPIGALIGFLIHLATKSGQGQQGGPFQQQPPQNWNGNYAAPFVAPQPPLYPIQSEGQNHYFPYNSPVGPVEQTPPSVDAPPAQPTDTPPPSTS